MSIGVGSRSKIQFEEEATYGVFPAGPPTNLAITSESLQKSINTIQSDLIRSDRRIPAIRGGNLAAGGDITTEMQPNAHGVFWKQFLADAATTAASSVSTAAFSATTVYPAGQMLKNAAGDQFYLVLQPGTSGASEPSGTVIGASEDNGTTTMLNIGPNETGWYTHEFTGGATFPTGGIAFEKVIERGATDAYFRYVGGRVNTLGITVPQEGIVTSTFGMLFQKESSADEVAANGFDHAGIDVSDEVFAGYDSSVELALKAVDTNLTHTLIPYLSGFSLNMTNEFDENIYAIPGRFRRELVDGRRVITGSMDIFFESMDEFNYFSDETVIDLRLGFVNTSGSVSIWLPECKLTGGSPTPQITGPGAIGTSLEFQAFYTGTGSWLHDAATFADIGVRMVNTTATI